MPIVVPSGAALATASVPVLPPAPGLFSTVTVMPGWRLWMSSAIRRPMMSGVAPGAKGTTSLTGLVGHGAEGDCADAGATSASSRPQAAADKVNLIGISSLMLWAHCAPVV